MGKWFVIGVVAAAILSLGAVSAKATTYYVSQSLGNDSWTGRAASPDGTSGPWKTLARASTEYLPGDRILLKCGDTWNEEIHPKGSGTPKDPITIGPLSYVPPFRYISLYHYRRLLYHSCLDGD